MRLLCRHVRGLVARRAVPIGSYYALLCASPAAYMLSRLVVASLLATAAVLKAALPLEGQFTSAHAEWLDDFSLGFWVVSFELALASWLAFGASLHPLRTWFVTAMTFFVFACFSLTKTISGQPCGCFGALQIDPFWTLICDICVLVLLVACRPAWRLARPVFAQSFSKVALSLAGVAWAVMTLGLYVNRPAVLGEDGVLTSQQRMVTLEPSDSWVGKRLPLLNHLADRDPLARGPWLVLLFSSTCGQCQTLMSRYNELANQLASARTTAPKVAFADVARKPHPKLVREAGAAELQLSSAHIWKLSKPCVVMMTDGTVDHVFQKPIDFQLIRRIWMQ